MAQVQKSAKKVARTPPLTGIPYEQVGALKAWWRARHPLPISPDAVNPHEMVVGVSGMGKSSYAELAATRDILNGSSVVFLDTHRDSFIKMLHTCIALGVAPENCIVVDLTDNTNGHIVVNPLVPEAGMPPYTAIDNLLAASRGLYGQSFGERQADVMRMLYMTLQYAELPLSYTIPFLTNPKVQKAILNKCSDEVGNFWAHLGSLRKGEVSLVVESTRNKWNAVISNPLLKPLFDDVTPTFSFYEAFRDGKIVLINLSRSHFKDDSSRGFMAAIFMSLMYSALLRRERDRDRPPVRIYCDEVSEYFIADFFLPILTGARKFGAGLKLFVQSLGRFSPHDLDVIFSTTGMLTSFSVGYQDSQRLSNEFIAFRNEQVIKKQDWDMYGGYGEASYFSAGEQKHHLHAELMNQIQREVVVRIKKADGIEVWTGNVGDSLTLTITPQQEVTYRQESARHYCRMPQD